MTAEPAQHSNSMTAEPAQHSDSMATELTAAEASSPRDPGDADRAGAETAARPGGAGDEPDRARKLFRYLVGDEWREYRAILGVFAGTFFAEFTPDEVTAEPAVADTGLDAATVGDRLESLHRWGNLTVSSSVGSPSSLEDYYRRRNRYLITRSGQEVFQLVEGVLSTVDEMADVQAGRLRDLNRALLVLGEQAASGFDRVPAEEVADAVRTVFDLHERFTTELTHFFADLNQWQSRYDLDAEEVRHFAGILVSYVSEQLTEIERMTRPIARSLEAIVPQLGALLPALRSGLAVRVDAAGLTESVAVRRLPGTTARDWEHLSEWFAAAPGRASRLDQLTRQAVAAVRTLTANVTRLSRVGLGASSRRSDFVRLAGFFDEAATRAEAHRIAAAAFGLGSCRRIGTLSGDADDPAPTVTSWRDAPRALVPVSLRERGDTSQRGKPTPIRDRRRERELMHRRRELERVAREDTAAELLSCAGADGRIDGSEMSVDSFLMLRELISRSGHTADIRAEVRTATDLGIRCTVRRVEGASTVVDCPDGRLVMHGLVVAVTAASEAAEGGSANGSAPDAASGSPVAARTGATTEMPGIETTDATSQPTNGTAARTPASTATPTSASTAARTPNGSTDPTPAGEPARTPNGSTDPTPAGEPARTPNGSTDPTPAGSPATASSVSTTGVPT